MDTPGLIEEGLFAPNSLRERPKHRPGQGTNGFNRRGHQPHRVDGRFAAKTAGGGGIDATLSLLKGRPVGTLGQTRTTFPAASSVASLQ